MRFAPGRWMPTAAGVFTAASPWALDRGRTYMFNDRRPPHAKFHIGQPS